MKDFILQLFRVLFPVWLDVLQIQLCFLNIYFCLNLSFYYQIVFIFTLSKISQILAKLNQLMKPIYQIFNIHLISTIFTFQIIHLSIFIKLGHNILNFKVSFIVIKLEEFIRSSFNNFYFRLILIQRICIYSFCNLLIWLR